MHEAHPDQEIAQELELTHQSTQSIADEMELREKELVRVSESEDRELLSVIDGELPSLIAFIEECTAFVKSITPARSVKGKESDQASKGKEKVKDKDNESEDEIFGFEMM